LQKGADPDIKWSNNETPLIMALRAESKCPEIAKCLIGEGADTRFCDAEGHSPFYYAKKAGYADLLPICEVTSLILLLSLAHRRIKVALLIQNCVLISRLHLHLDQISNKTVRPSLLG
jgi:ankyrin repeat protein